MIQAERASEPRVFGPALSGGVAAAGEGEVLRRRVDERVETLEPISYTYLYTGPTCQLFLRVFG